MEEIIKVLEALGGKATSEELMEELAPKYGVVKARLMISEAVRKGIIKKVPDYELRKEVFVLQKPNI